MTHLRIYRGDEHDPVELPQPKPSSKWVKWVDIEREHAHAASYLPPGLVTPDGKPTPKATKEGFAKHGLWNRSKVAEVLAADSFPSMDYGTN